MLKLTARSLTAPNTCSIELPGRKTAGDEGIKELKQLMCCFSGDHLEYSFTDRWIGIVVIQTSEAIV